MRARKRVELASYGCEAGSRVQVVVGAERDYEDLCLVTALIGRDHPRFRIDGGDGLAQEPHARFLDRGVRESDLVSGHATEHHVELRVAEHEGVAVVDQRHPRMLTERVGQDRRELEAAEARAQNEDARSHEASLRR